MVHRFEQVKDSIQIILRFLHTNRSGYKQIVGSGRFRPWVNRGDNAICVENLELMSANRDLTDMASQYHLGYYKAVDAESYFRTHGQRTKIPELLTTRQPMIMEMYEAFSNLLDGESADYLKHMPLLDKIPICEVKVEEL